MRCFFVIVVILLISVTEAQVKEYREGIVSYISPQNVYVKFESTSSLTPGDTLYKKSLNELTPCILIKFLSSKSAAGEILNNHQLQIDDRIIAVINIQENSDYILKSDSVNKVFPEKDYDNSTHSSKRLEHKSGRYTGRLSLQSYSYLSSNSTSDDIQRWRYSLSFYGDNIYGTPLSMSAFLNFSYKANEWYLVKSDLGRHLRVYDLALNYVTDTRTNIWLGRFLNRRISSIGSIDGIQAERPLSNYFIGAAAGSRPDYDNMSLNLKLFEFGFYAGRTDTLKGGGASESTIGFFQQTNNFIIDRRFIYLQHYQNGLIPDINLFFSAEADLYKKTGEQADNQISLTGILTSLRWTPASYISTSIGYDARKNIIYYETFKNFIDSLIDNEIRQGFRWNVNLRPIKNIIIGGGFNYRYRKSDLKQSEGYNGNITWSSIPFIESSSTISFNRIMSSYIEGNIWGIGLYKNFGNSGIDAGINFRNTEYLLLSGNEKVVQNSVLIDMGWSIIRQLYLTISYETAFENKRNDSRILLDLTTRLSN